MIAELVCADTDMEECERVADCELSVRILFWWLPGLYFVDI